MTDYGRGAKAGAMAGVVSGIVLSIGYYFLFSIILTDVIRAAIQANLPAGTTVDAVLAAAMVVVIVGVLVGTIIAGVILGLLFAAVYDKYMKSSTPTMKGLVFGIILWLIGIVLDIPDFYYGATYIAVSALIGLVGSLIFGYLLGRFYGGSVPKMPAQPSTASNMTG